MIESASFAALIAIMAVASLKALRTNIANFFPTLVVKFYAAAM